ncbi:MAG: aminopeptidase [Pseudomonadota bacterium]
MLSSAGRIAWVLLAIFLAGCSNVGYYAQSVSGHLEVMRRAQPIPQVLADPATPDPVKHRLERVLTIREFASRALGLPDNGSYRRYAALDRPYVVWNVFATPELSTQLIEWCFPVAGCVGYRGYYAREEAEAFAAGLEARGYDVLVRGVPAYSTLGWFDDPVLSTLLRYPETEIARLIFHELAHQVAYVRDDSVFNESFATAVEREGVRRWLEAQGTEALRAAEAAARGRREDFVRLVLEYRDRLEEVYGADLSREEKRARKGELLGALAKDYRQLKERWGGFSGYDRWFEGKLNNAHLASVAAYTQLVPAFEALLAREGGDLPRFYAAVKALARRDKAARLAALEALAARAGGTEPTRSPPQEARARRAQW